MLSIVAFLVNATFRIWLYSEYICFQLRTTLRRSHTIKTIDKCIMTISQELVLCHVSPLEYLYLVVVCGTPIHNSFNGDQNYLINVYKFTIQHTRVQHHGHPLLSLLLQQPCMR